MASHNVIIVEGPDKVGKSTIIDTLAMQYRAAGSQGSVLKYGAAKSADPYLEQRTKFEESLELADTITDAQDFCIMDRSYVGEAVYAPMYARPHPDYLDELHREFVKKLNPLYVLVDGEPKLAGASSHDKAMAQSHEQVSHGFQQFFSRHRQKMIGVSTDSGCSASELAGIIRSVASTGWYEVEAEASSMYAYTLQKPVRGWYNVDIKPNHPHYEQHVKLWGNEYIGPVVPRTFEYAVFGEAPGQFGCGLTGLPFYFDRSGMLLRRALFDLGLSPDLWMMGNVFHSTPPSNKLVPDTLKMVESYDFLDHKANPHPQWFQEEMMLFARDMQLAARSASVIMAAGKIASAACRRLKEQMHMLVPVVATYHPAYYLYKGEPGKAVLDYGVKLAKAGVETLW